MRYSPAGADDMHRTSRGDDMPSIREPPNLILRFGEPLLREPPGLAHSLRGTPTVAWINKNRTFVGRQMFCFCCEEAHKRCVGIGKNAKKVRDLTLLSVRQIGI